MQQLIIARPLGSPQVAQSLGVPVRQCTSVADAVTALHEAAAADAVGLRTMGTSADGPARTRKVLALVAARGVDPGTTLFDSSQGLDLGWNSRVSRRPQLWGGAVRVGLT